MDFFRKTCIVVLAIMIILAALRILTTPVRYDSTDNPPNRSGFTIRVDAKTGCEYLTIHGGVTPRMNVNGKQEGCR